MLFKIAFWQLFDNFNVNLRKKEGFLTSIPCIPIPEYGQSNAPLAFEFKLVVTTIFIVCFPVLRQHPFTIYMYLEEIQCQFSLYLKKAGLARRNIVHYRAEIGLKFCCDYLMNFSPVS